MEQFIFYPEQTKKSPGTILVEEIIRAYPALHAASWELRNTYCTTRLTKAPVSGKGGRKDPTASAALRELPPDEKRKYQAIQQAIRRTHYRKNKLARLALVDLVYWKRTHTLAEAAAALSCSLQEAESFRDEFIQMVKEALGISDCEGCKYYRKLLPTIRACHYCLDTFHPRIHDIDGCYSKRLEDGPCPYYEEEVI